MIKLIVTDLDGTFLNSQGGFDRPLFEQTRTLMASKGVHFAACTGKQCERVEELFGELARDVWIVGDSATRIKFNGEFIYQSLLPNDLGLRMIKTLRAASSRHVIIACTNEGAFISRDTPARLQDKVRGSYTRVVLTDDLNSISADFVKITIYDEEGNCAQTLECLRPYQYQAYMVVSEACWLDIADYGVHKGSTIQRLQKQLNVGKHETMAFGDGYNDLELLAEAEYSFAMRNGFEETKRAANFVTGSNDENAVLETIRRLLVLQP